MSDSDPIRPALPKPPSTWLTLLMGAVLLICGVVIGAGATVLVVKNRMDQPGAHPEQFNRRLTERMTRDLDLTSEQREQIRAVFDAHHDEMKSIREDVDDRVGTLRESMKEEVRAILTAEQMSQWENRVRDYDRGDRRGPGRDGPGRDGPRRDGPRDERPPREHFDGPPPRHLRDGVPPPPPPDERLDRRRGDRDDDRRPRGDGTTDDVENRPPPPPPPSDARESTPPPPQ